MQEFFQRNLGRKKIEKSDSKTIIPILALIEQMLNLINYTAQR